MIRKIWVGMGYHEDLWHSSRLHAEQLCSALQESEYAGRDVSIKLFAPELGRKPNPIDRRLRFGSLVPDGDIFHLIDPAYADGVFAAKKRCTNVVVTVTDCAFWLHRNAFNTFLRKRIVEGLRAADRLIAISKKTADEMEEVLGIKADRVIYLGSEPAKFPFSATERKKKLLLHVGSVVHRKGLDRIFRLLYLLPQTYQFLQVGGTFTTEQNELIDKLGIRSRISQQPFSALENLVSAYQEAELLCFPSRFEGYGVPCIEARLSGTACLMSDEVPSYELLTNDPRTKVIDGTVLDELSTPGGYEVAEWIQEADLSPMDVQNRTFHTWGRVASEVSQVYDELLSAERKSA